MTYKISVTIFILVVSTACSDEELFLENGRDVTLLDNEEKVPIVEATGVAGSVARLPCDLSTKLPGDKVHLVLWYKEGHKDGVGIRVPLIPVYSLDARGDVSQQTTDSGAPQHWSDASTFGSRAHFDRDDLPMAALAIDALRDKDGGVYRCRVDFKRSPTRNSRVNLTVIIPPERLSVVDSNGVHIQHYILGPYSEGASLEIACIATGGRPTPRVTWWQENALLDDTWESLSERSVRNVLKIERLERKHLNTVFTCQASNNNLVAPISSAVTLDLNLSPLWVRLLGENKPVSAGQRQEVRCESVGARPVPHLVWWKGSQLLPNSTQETSTDGNRTVSTLRYTPSMDDSAALLKCRVVDSSSPPHEDTWSLNVRHPPVVSLEMGDGDPRFVKEGSDVSLECVVRANPWIYRVTWKHNGRLLYDNGYNNGVILNNQSLLVRNVSRSHSGYYSCTASNQEGDGESDQFYLGVKFAPVCRPGQQTVIAASRFEAVHVTCEVEADPDDVTFTWSYDDVTYDNRRRHGDVTDGDRRRQGGITDDDRMLQGDVTDDDGRRHGVFTDDDRRNQGDVTDDDTSVQFDVERTRSTAMITPLTASHFGNISCWANNVLGKQRQPCVFQLVSAGRPEAVHNCSVLNQTEDLVVVGCAAGFDGGLGQAFQLELYDGAQLLRNVSSAHAQPHFTLQPLPAADSHRLQLRVYAFNHKGRSPYVTLQLLNSNHAERRTAAVTVKLTPLIGALIGMVGALILIALAVGLALYLRSRECPPPKKQQAPSLDSLENNPDIITNCNGHETENEKDVDKLLRGNFKEKPDRRVIRVDANDTSDQEEKRSILRERQSTSATTVLQQRGCSSEQRSFSAEQSDHSMEQRLSSMEQRDCSIEQSPATAVDI